MIRVQSTVEPAMSQTEPELLTKSFELGYNYTRSTGPVIGRFLTALRDGRIEGVRAADGRVFVPAIEYDPRDGAPLTDTVAVADTGTVTTWCWVQQPLSHHLLQHPFAFALVKLDGADVPLLHLVDAGSEARMRTGMRVRARWNAERSGSITDIACFEPEASA
jgi:uncharacterized OB-fold protein